MRISLDRRDVLKLIETGKIRKDGVTVTMSDSRQEAAAQRFPPVIVEIPIRPPVRDWEPARELVMRTDNPFRN